MVPAASEADADFLLEIHMRSYGIDVRSRGAARLYTNAEAVLLDRRTGREIWNSRVRGTDRLTPHVVGMRGVPGTVITAGTLHTVTVADFQGTTITLTNPGTIGTNHSVPRLMPGQGTIIAVGAMDYPAQFQGAAGAALDLVNARYGLTFQASLMEYYLGNLAAGTDTNAVGVQTVGRRNLTVRDCSVTLPGERPAPATAFSVVATNPAGEVSAASVRGRPPPCSRGHGRRPGEAHHDGRRDPRRVCPRCRCRR